MTIKTGKRKLLPPPDPSEFLPVADLSFFSSTQPALSSGDLGQTSERDKKRTRNGQGDSMDVIPVPQRRNLLDLPDDFLQRVYGGTLPQLSCFHRLVCSRLNSVLPGAEKVVLRVNQQKGHLVRAPHLTRYTSLVELSARRCRDVVGPLAEALLSGWSAVTSLDLSFNDAGNNAIAQLADGLYGNRKLRVLLLGHNRITSHGEGSLGAICAVSSIAKSMATWTALEELDLEGNELYSHGCQKIATGLSSCAHLKILGLRGCMLMDAGAIALASALSSNSSLSKLSVENNALSADGVAALAGSSSSLQHLLLDGNMPFRCTSVPDGRERVVEALSALHGIRTLSLFNCQISPADIPSLAQMLYSLTDLRCIDLSWNLRANDGDDVGWAIIHLLTSPLSQMLHLEKVDLSGNNFGATERTAAELCLTGRVRWHS